MFLLYISEGILKILFSDSRRVLLFSEGISGLPHNFSSPMCVSLG